ncbi:SufE protein probably involved in Fe-S center assembly [Idiomarina sp. A28L]|uniref:SufE family protein n=1 Tax=Idiomarina sp. A28L TaxID=1036674 RepID=UPI00021385D9|nr:SufE family protein [Idiomarina sp. A28L]EGN74744.1 SufE protein probably involved in Fe-S center assembly [Idiomarina sp. A28L]
MPNSNTQNMNAITNGSANGSATGLAVEINPAAAEILKKLQQSPHWEQRYRYVLELAKGLPSGSVEHTQAFAVSGCEAPVWLKIEQTADNTLRFHADSSSRLIRGLLVILLAPVQNQPAAYILSFSFNDWLQCCGLQQQLTPSRSNGLFHICQHAKAVAKTFI